MPLFEKIRGWLRSRKKRGPHLIVGWQKVVGEKPRDFRIVFSVSEHSLADWVESPLRIGRESDVEKNHVEVGHAPLTEGVSKKQWLVQMPEHGRVYLTDRGSARGTHLNGRRIVPPRKEHTIELAHGDVASTAGGVLCAVLDLNGSLARLKDTDSFKRYVEQRTV